MKKFREGGCYCGAARYRINLDAQETGNCHCTQCRRHSAAPYATFTSVPTSQFEWLSEPSGKLVSSEYAWRHYCRDCGTPLTFQTTKGIEDIAVNTATIDDPSGLPPTYEIFTSSRMEGVPVVEGAVQFEQEE